MNIIFLGTPEFSVPSLKALINSRHKIVAVVTQPDKPMGRSNKLQFSPVKKIALENNIPIFQFEKIRRDGVYILKNINADIMITCAYGQILSKDNLESAKLGTYNIHGSLLPKYRGASPIQWAIINGEKQTGITILKSDVGIDDGQILHQVKTEIKTNETAEELYKRLSYLGADAILSALDKLENRSYKLVVQDESKATFCKMFTKEMGLLDFNETTQNVVNKINGLNMWPVCFAKLNGVVYKFFKAEIWDNYKEYDFKLTQFENGSIVVAKSKIGLIIKCNDGFLKVLEIQAENNKRMDTHAFLNGKNLHAGKFNE